MIFRSTPIAGAFLVEPERLADERGFFARTFCREEFEERDLEPVGVQCSISFNLRRGTLRGMHWQAEPHGEAKLVRCTRGSLHDVIVDLRRGTPGFRRHAAFELSAENRRQLYVPRGVAHGFLTLEDATEVFYQMSAPFHSESARGVRWDDPAFAIEWPARPAVISERDRTYPDFEP